MIKFYSLGQAWRKASANCVLVSMGRGQYIVQYPWRGINGPRAETNPRPYWQARTVRSDLALFTALELMGYDRESCDWAVNMTKNALGLVRLRAAVKALGPVVMGEPL